MILFLVFFSLLYLIYYLSTYKFDIWKNKKVVFEKPVPLLGNFKDYILLKRPLYDIYSDLCKKFRNEPFFGVFYGTAPTLVVQDPELIKTICTKDFYYFNSRENAKWMDTDPVGKAVTGAWGDTWKVHRQNLTPVFTSAKIKNMFYFVANGSKTFEKLLREEVKINSSLNGYDLMSQFTMSGIGSCAFGVDTHTMDTSVKNNAFTRSGSLIFFLNKFKAFITIIRSLWPSLYYCLGFNVLSSETFHFFINMVQDILKQRGYKSSKRNDFIDLLLPMAVDKKIVGDGLTNPATGENKRFTIETNDEMLALSCIAIFAAGYETTALTMTRALYELSQDQKSQKRAQQEIDDYLRKYNNKIEYDTLSELEFLQACIDETLRLHPVLPLVTREVTENYEFTSGLKLEKGLRVHIPVYSIHRNPDNFSHPDEFKPDRFMPGQKENVRPYTYMPFGEGPRFCIGMRFAKMQLVAGLVTVLKKYDVEAKWTPTPDFRLLLNVIIPKNDLKMKLEQRVDDQINNYNLD